MQFGGSLKEDSNYFFHRRNYMDILQKCYDYMDVKNAKATGIYPFFIPLTENEGTEAEFKGHRLIMCGSNNYLGLTTHPKVKKLP